MNGINTIITFVTLYVGLLSAVVLWYQQTALMSAAVDVDTKAALATAANEARGLAMDSIAAAHSGHMGLPLGAAEIGATLYGMEVSKLDRDVSLANLFWVHASAVSYVKNFYLTLLLLHRCLTTLTTHNGSTVIASSFPLDTDPCFFTRG